jgi:probable F420-dependent oxidoreductase
MDFGLHLGTRGVAGDPVGLRALAEQADRLGLAYLGFSDHIVFTQQARSQYPYSRDGKHPVQTSGYCLDQLTCLTYAAAVTKQIRLLTSVMVVPHRAPILTAKTLASIDVLSNGRVTVGAGVGWLAEEMAVLGSPPYEKRGAASNEYIAAFRSLWTQSPAAFDGDHVKFRDVVFEPKPVQKSIPIWIGGEGKAARRRAGRIGDGWYPMIRNPKEPLERPEDFSVALADVRREAELAGRDPTKLDVALFVGGYWVGTPQLDGSGKRVPFTGSPAQIADDARAYREVGVKHLVVGFESNVLSEALDRVEQFTRDVTPLV